MWLLCFPVSSDAFWCVYNTLIKKDQQRQCVWSENCHLLIKKWRPDINRICLPKTNFITTCFSYKVLFNSSWIKTIPEPKQRSFFSMSRCTKSVQTKTCLAYTYNFVLKNGFYIQWNTRSFIRLHENGHVADNNRNHVTFLGIRN